MKRVTLLAFSLVMLGLPGVRAAEALQHGEDAALREPLTRLAASPLPAERWRLWLSALP